MSYTTFSRALAWTGRLVEGLDIVPKLSIITDSNDDADPDAVIDTVEATIINTGPVTGDEVVLLFVKPPANAVALGAPLQQLAAFHRVTLKPGQSVTQRLDIRQAHVWSILPAQARVAAVKLGDWRVFTNADEDKALSFTVSRQ